MKISRCMQKSKDSPSCYDMRVDLTRMTEREFINAMKLIEEIIPKLDVVLQRAG